MPRKKCTRYHTTNDVSITCGPMADAIIRKWRRSSRSTTHPKRRYTRLHSDANKASRLPTNDARDSVTKICLEAGQSRHQATYAKRGHSERWASACRHCTTTGPGRRHQRQRRATGRPPSRGTAARRRCWAGGTRRSPPGRAAGASPTRPSPQSPAPFK